MLTIRYQTAFKKDYKRIKKRGYDMHLLSDVIEMIAEQKLLDERYLDHLLSGVWSGYRECHITSDWLLNLQGVRSGTYSFSDQDRNSQQSLWNMMTKTSRIEKDDSFRNPPLRTDLEAVQEAGDEGTGTMSHCL